MGRSPYFFDRYRGDRKPFEIVVMRSAAHADGPGVADITGWTFRLTANTEQNPTDDTNQVFQLTGIVDDPLTGQVRFEPGEDDVDHVDVLWFDIAYSIGGVPWETLEKDQMRFTQDVGK